MMDNQAYTGSMIQQIPGYNSAEALRIRLDTQTLLSEVEAHLRGEIVYTDVDQKTGREVIRVKKCGEPLANKEGQHKVLMWVRMRVSHATVQGNFKSKDDFMQFISSMYSRLNFDVHRNCNQWGIKDGDLRYLIGGIMDMVELFLSRTIDNEERKLFGGIKETSKEERRTGGRTWYAPGGREWQR